MNKINVDKSWTLFLDRDGVLNKEIEGTYVLDVESLQILDGVLPALEILSKQFGTIVIVTNQRCIGKGMLTVDGFHDIQRALISSITEAGGRIDGYYFAPNVETDAPLRKPNNGMALLAQNDFPEIDFSKSVMVGNNTSDMKFGKTCGMHTVFLTTTKSKLPEEAEQFTDEVYDSLFDWAEKFQ